MLTDLCAQTVGSSRNTLVPQKPVKTPRNKVPMDHTQSSTDSREWTADDMTATTDYRGDRGCAPGSLDQCQAGRGADRAGAGAPWPARMQIDDPPCMATKPRCPIRSVGG